MAITAIVVYAPYSNEMRNALMNFSLNKFIFSIFTLQYSYLLGSKILKSYRLFKSCGRTLQMADGSGHHAHRHLF